MKKNEVIELVLSSFPENWDFNDEKGLYIFNDNVRLIIKRDDSDINSNTKFKESWVKKYPDSTAYKVKFEIIFENVSVKDFYCALVDGCRMYIPFPKSIHDLRITNEQYKFGKIINSGFNDSFDYYLERGGILIEEIVTSIIDNEIINIPFNNNPINHIKVKLERRANNILKSNFENFSNEIKIF